MNKISYYLQNKSNQLDENAKSLADKSNTAPCAKCGGTDFIQLYRNVVGKVEGSVQGYFSLFGGTVSGNIDGETSTLPVLSCTKCNNERTIKTWEYTWEKDLFWSDMHEFYFGITKNNFNYLSEIPQIYLENPVDTRYYAKKNRNLEHDFYNCIPFWSPKEWAKAGFKIQKIKDKKWWGKEYERYPTWKELELLTSSND